MRPWCFWLIWFFDFFPRSCFCTERFSSDRNFWRKVNLCIEMNRKTSSRHQALRNESLSTFVFTPRRCLFGLVSGIALLAVDCAVARGNDRRWGNFLLLRACVSPCVHVPVWLGGIVGHYLHPNTAVYLYTLMKGSIHLPRSRSLPRLLMATYQGSIMMRQKEIALELQWFS